jgi:hypothetical protein
MKALCPLLQLVFCTATILASAACEPAPVPPQQCGPTAKGSWDLVFEDPARALLSAWGSSASDVWLVGTQHFKQPDSGPTVLHWDGKAWQRLQTGQKGTLWWVSGPSGGIGGNDLWMAGTNGLILQYNRASGAFKRHTAPSDKQLFGIQAASDSDAWAVGGQLGCAGESGGVIWHWDGKAWTDETRIDKGAADGVPCFMKVWVRSATDAFIVGATGRALRWDGKAWSKVATGTDRTLLTVHGNANLAVAVGGFNDGVILERKGGEFVSVVPAFKDGGPKGLNGVWIRSDGSGSAVGVNGEVWQRSTAGKWQRSDTNLEFFFDYHATYADPACGVWAVGGQLTLPPQSQGALAHFGAPISKQVPVP